VSGQWLKAHQNAVKCTFGWSWEPCHSWSLSLMQNASYFPDRNVWKGPPSYNMMLLLSAWIILFLNLCSLGDSSLWWELWPEPGGLPSSHYNTHIIKQIRKAGGCAVLDGKYLWRRVWKSVLLGVLKKKLKALCSMGGFDLM